jgi:amino acid transporter
MKNKPEKAQLKKPHSAKLGQLAATAICGNDITSSCLYVSALAVIYSGRLAPLALLIVAAVLFLYRGIYAEVVGALPFNGGAYNALLNTTSKYRASVAACLTLLSYMATAVISASEAMHYLRSLWEAIPVREATIALLALFCFLTILGITDSAKVAIGIFLAHLGSLALLLIFGLVYLLQNGFDVFWENMHTPSPGGFGMALFFGFSAAMLGISGFESSANFVEEQEDGVFPKTLRNMWLAVSILNPTIALLALALIPIHEVEGVQESLLATMANDSSGPWLSNLIAADAVLVLSGAVLTSYVGVSGLVYRMTLDRCLPQFLLKANRRGSNHRILISFFFMAVSVLLITKGELKALAGVYTISFLAVMALFGVGNMLLKVKRENLPRPSSVGWGSVLLAIAMVLVGLVGNAVMNPPYLKVFLEYFIPTLLVVTIMLTRVTLLKGVLSLLRAFLRSVIRPMTTLRVFIREKIEEINSQQVVFFTRGDHLANLNKVMLYLKRNEHSDRLKLVTVVREGEEAPKKLEADIEFLNQAYPEIEIEFIVRKGTFGPRLINSLSKEWGIPLNLMFIGSPGGNLQYSLADLGGVRLII